MGVASMANENTALVPPDFPASVYESLAELRQVAREAESRDDPRLRRATDQEIALATTQHKEWMCSGHSSRTGLPCRKGRVLGMTVCRRHGGALKRVKAKAEKRLRAALMPVLESMIDVAVSGENENARVKAAGDLMDRFGLGEVVQAKVRSSKGNDGASRVNVVIGFLNHTTPVQSEASPPVTIEAEKTVPKNGRGDR
jgi:hypothetical protein